MAKATYVVVVPAKSEFKTIKDMQKSARPVKYGSQGFGTTDFVVDVVGAKLLDIPMTMVSGYKGSAEVIMGALRGDVDAMSYPITSLLQHIRSGDLRPVAVLDTKRSELLPDTPSISELGYPNVVSVAKLFRLVGGPPNLPPDITKILRETMAKAMQDPELLAWSKKAIRPLEYTPAGEVEEIVTSAYSAYGKYEADMKRYGTESQSKGK
jgi:tripartite-type tricarboxylate transporter receptor subunit TctC